MEQQETQPVLPSVRTSIWAHFGFYNVPGKKEQDVSYLIGTNTRAHIICHLPDERGQTTLKFSY